jgi:hypothetical protein
VTRNGWGVGTLVLRVAVLAAACGQGESGSENGERSANASESANEGDSAEDGTFQGVVDSYEVAQREIEEEGGEQRVGEYRVGYIIEPAEGWWEGDPKNLTWREPAPSETGSGYHADRPGQVRQRSGQ